MQVVVFSIEKSYFAINTNVVQSINNTMKVTKVPKSSKFIKGLINIRGSIKTLVNINLILDVAENSPKENIMILSLKEEDIAIEVDFVKEVLEIEEKDVEVLDECDKDYMLGVLKRNNNLITVLDMEKLIQNII
ncbi:MAG: chemotaxis protein CheW [Clostridium baratii]|uniref:chemotaxis protein CheW n=1 Tax=Clostridium baratii TaxID=1561 RepID=UPI0006BEC046|nr:chemotaxis protein CheW [Clostridium baratii]MBS6006414.1 chemotaxis protein CheW [Clostridium baratii]MBS6043449.1 chemotaxis protein CheW [Clostridium baratii]MDU1053916.1 chemotaxis protein CheW [Clostridium baratii]MDU4910819.1 chemotaxis protein CheW [Clostridium baratii]CUO89415.1 chemotaxis protein CheW [Clostridium baratii]